MGDEQKLFRHILEEQQKLLGEYEAAILSYEKSDVIEENRTLKKALEELKVCYGELQEKYKAVKVEADGLHWTLQDQLLSEKVSLLSKSEEKLKTYFKGQSNEVIDQMTSFEKEMKQKAAQLQYETSKALNDEVSIFREQIEALHCHIRESMDKKQQQLKQQEEALSKQVNTHYQDLKAQPLSSEVVAQRIKQNNIEVKIGLNALNKAGMLLILIGVISVMRYSFTNYFSNEVKGIFGLLVGICFLLGGEYCEQKGKKIFAQGLIGGGIGIFYLTIFSSYFILDILNIPGALILSVLVSLTAFILCLRYDASTIAVLALIGGYLPMIAYSIVDRGIDNQFIYISMGYVLLLNSVTLLISYKKNWSVLQYVSFFTNMPVAILLATGSEHMGMAFLYSFIHFMMYMLVLLSGPIKLKGKLSTGKIVMMGIHTLVSCSMIWDQLIRFNLKEWMGLLALVFCISFYGLNRLIMKLAEEEKEVQTIFSVTALMFAILVVPLQFGAKYITLGWLIEGVLLNTYGFKQDEKRLEIGGRLIFGLCIGTFYLLTPFASRYNLYYYMTHLGMVIGMVWLLIMYLYPQRVAIDKGKPQKGSLMLYKYFTLFNVWVLFITISKDAISYYKQPIQQLLGSNMPIEALCFSIVTAVILIFMDKIHLLYDRYMKRVTRVGFCFINLVGVASNYQMYVKSSWQAGASYHIVSILVLILWNSFLLWCVSELIKYIVVKNTLSVEVYPLAIASFIIGNLTLIMDRQFNIGLNSVFISIFYSISALILIVCGFKWGYRWVRYCGLTLCILALGKIFIFDFAVGVAACYKMISYFAFGVILLIISYLYQKFSKKLENQLPTVEKGEKYKDE